MTDKVKNACAPVIGELGYELADVTYAQEYGVWELTLFIKTKSGAPVTHKDCERVSVAVDEIIERLDITQDHYHLSVASMGIKD